MSEIFSFGEWVSQRRKSQRLTQRELAARAACAVATVKKIEMDERHPSAELALTLASALAVPPDWRDTFVECARGQRPVDALAAMQTAAQSQPVTPSLPAAATPFVGRDAELAQIARLLAQPDCRLLTLVGAGGVGKTRLALEMAHSQRERLEDGVAFVPLAAVTQADLIPSAIINSLNLTLTGPEQLLAYLRDQSMLLVLDNCEQLGEGVTWISQLLAHAPAVKLLATSRERLQLAEEWTFAVPEMTQAQAIRLFEQTARRVVPGFVLDGQQAAVTAICQSVENLPLALELAASWLRLMSCSQIADHIRSDIDFLTANVRNIPERHRSVRAVFDHSWKLLSEPERDAFMRLSVFRGGWTVEAAAQVAGARLSLLRDLVEKSLVRAAGDQRYDMHELIRQYAEEKLHESGLETETHLRHAETYLTMAEQILIKMAGTEANRVIQKAEIELNNFRSVLEWTINSGRVEMALRLLVPLFLPWLRCGYLREGEYWNRAALTAAGEAENKWVCHALINLSNFLAIQGRYMDAMPFRQKSLAMAYRLEDPDVMLSVAEQGMQAEFDLNKAQQWFEQFISLVADWDHIGRDARMASAHFLFGDRLRTAGRFDEARDYYQKSIELFSTVNSDMKAYPIGNLGRVALQVGQLQEAYDLISQSVAISRISGSRIGIADWIQRQGEVLLHMGDLAQAEACFDEALALYQEMGNYRAMPDMLAALGHVALLRGNMAEASDRFRASLALYRELYTQLNNFVDVAQATDYGEMTPDALIHELMGTALIAADQGDYERTVVLLAAADLLRHRDARRLEPALLQLGEKALAEARQHLDAATFARAWEQGRAMSIGDILDYALMDG